MDNYDNLGNIGEGTYGMVWRARHRGTGQVVAIKKFKESDADEQVRKTALREIRILKQLKHENIVSLIEVFRHNGKLYLVFEYVEKTILEDLESNPNGMAPEDARKVFYQLLKSLEFMHSHDVIHRDIKPENLLISKNGVLKLCDFGFARGIGGPGSVMTDYVATRWYRSPELLVGDKYDKLVDVWAAGCMFAEILNGLPLFPGESDIDQLAHIMSCFGKLLPKHEEVFRKNPLYVGVKLPEVKCTEPLVIKFAGYAKSVVDIMAACLLYDTNDRSPCSQLVNHKYFDGFVDTWEGEFRDKVARDKAENEAFMKTRRKNKSRTGKRKEDRERKEQQRELKEKEQREYEAREREKATAVAAVERAERSERERRMRDHEDDEIGFEVLNDRKSFSRAESNSESRAPSRATYANEQPRPESRANKQPKNRKEKRQPKDKSERDKNRQEKENHLLPNLPRATTPRANRLIAFPTLTADSGEAQQEAGNPAGRDHNSGIAWENDNLHYRDGRDDTQRREQEEQEPPPSRSKGNLRKGSQAHTQVSKENKGGFNFYPQIRGGAAGGTGLVVGTFKLNSMSEHSKKKDKMQPKKKKKQKNKPKANFPQPFNHPMMESFTYGAPPIARRNKSGFNQHPLNLKRY